MQWHKYNSEVAAREQVGMEFGDTCNKVFMKVKFRSMRKNTEIKALKLQGTQKLIQALESQGQKKTRIAFLDLREHGRQVGEKKGKKERAAKAISRGLKSQRKKQLQKAMLTWRLNSKTFQKE